MKKLLLVIVCVAGVCALFWFTSTVSAPTAQDGSDSATATEASPAVSETLAVDEVPSEGGIDDGEQTCTVSISFRSATSYEKLRDDYDIKVKLGEEVNIDAPPIDGQVPVGQTANFHKICVWSYCGHTMFYVDEELAGMLLDKDNRLIDDRLLGPCGQRIWKEEYVLGGLGIGL